MRKIALVYLLPFVIALLTISWLSSNEKFSSLLWHSRSSVVTPEPAFDYIPYFKDRVEYEDQFLGSGSSRPVIYLLGSSELSTPSEAIPYRFISKYFNTQVRAIGHAGNQCFSIYSQLLANKERLHDADVVIIISPGWFEGKNSAGTSSEVFLEFNSERFLSKIVCDTIDSDLKAYEEQRISGMYSEFNAPNIPIKLMNFEYKASKSPVHKVCFLPLFIGEKMLLLRRTISSQPSDKRINIGSIIPVPFALNWDSLFRVAKQHSSNAATTNTMGINDDYYRTYIHGGTGKIAPVSVSCNQELKDFKMLLHLLKEKDVRASFIISPLNPLYYKNLSELDPVIDVITGEIKELKFPYLNLYVSDPAKYEKSSLADIMHMADYGWYEVDHFIAKNYHLIE